MPEDPSEYTARMQSARGVITKFDAQAFAEAFSNLRCGLHRVCLTYDGQEILGITTDVPRPRNRHEMLELLTSALESLRSPTVEDPDLI